MTLPQQPGAGQPPPQSQHFLLKWNNHRSNMVSVFESLLQSENLVDVTLAVEGKFLKGHKIVLSACSPYFESMFVNQTPGEKHPILIFHDMKFSHLKTLLDFMYRGEISIDEKDLSDVLKVAEALSIRGLSSFESDDEDGPDNKSSSEPSNHGSNDPLAASTSSPAPTGSSSTNCPAYGSYNGNNSSNNANNNNNGASINNNNESNNNQQTQSQSDNHCISGNMNCDSSVNGSTRNVNSSSSTSNSSNNNNSTNTTTNNNNTSSSTGSTSKHHGRGATSARNQKKGNYASQQPRPQPPSPPPAPASTTGGVKRRRGRQPVRKDITSSPSSRASSYKQAHTERSMLKNKYQASSPPVKTLSSRQRVRRRMPRSYPSSMNAGRIKVEKHSDTEETGSGAVSGTTTPDDDEMDTSDFMVPDMDGASGILPSDICNSEPLSEMSVRGLDLFKYASIEDGVYRCIECEKLCIPKTFKNKYSFQRHAFLYHEGNMRKVFPCPVCSREFSRPDKMKNHLRSIHEGGKGVRHNNNGSSSNDPTGHGGDSNDFNDKCDV